MIYFSIIILFIITTLSYLKEKNFYNPVFLFSVFWLLIVLFSGLNPFNVFTPSENVYFIVTIGVTSFAIPNLLILKKYSAVPQTFQNTSSVISIFSVYIFVVLSIFFGLYNFSNVMRLINQGYTLDYIRFIYYNVELVSYDLSGISIIDKFIETYFYIPFLYFNIAFIASLIVLNKVKEHKLLFLLTFINMGLFSFNSGGRVIVYILIIEFVISILMVHKNAQKSFKNIFLIAIVSFFGIIFMNQISALRMIDGGNVLKNIYLYFAGSLTHFSVLESNSIVQSTYGVSYIAGFIQPVFMVVKNLFGIEYPNAIETLLTNLSYFQQPRDIGGGVTYNAFVTMFYFFFIDFGYFGVIFFSFIYGAIMRFFYIKIKTNKISYLIVYFLLLQSLFTSMVRWQFSIVSFAVSFYIVIALQILKKVKIK
ncbi:MAG: Glycosyltransferase [Candidatus Magasanikbacteria bacterium GW2011_GWC2_34_16]|uniref:Glycosyltransferase n=1 Tax=Candidatus Magasanikbacteria bacterium GW2011_GWC2_34_16 TaxID=1619045 RepID=A0A0G0D7K2_9BACT|nr:MAG: Glycosyltransferase [Candidatus Magasanikbacteria bacterium GW2011_GWC2_34_16]